MARDALQRRGRSRGRGGKIHKLSMIRRSSFVFAIALLATCCSASEYAVMRNGFALKHERREVVGEITRLYLTATSPSSFVDVPSGDIEHFEKDEIVIAPEE